MPKIIDNKTIDEIKNLYENKYSNVNQISKKIGIPTSIIYKYIKNKNMKPYFSKDWKLIPEHNDYICNLKDNRIVKIGYGEVKYFLNKSIGYYSINLNGKLYLLHRIIYACHHGYYPEYVDHIDGNTLNNNIENLRECTVSQNSMNSNIYKTNKTGYKGVNFCKRSNKYRARITLNYKVKNLGYFNDPIEAAKVYDEAAIKHHGEFAKTNEMLNLI